MATRIWRGDAAAVAQVSTLTVANTWAQNDTVVITLNGKSMTVTIGTLVTTAQVATTLAEAWNGTTLTDTNASVSITGTSISEFTEITASTSGSDLILTADTAGKPFDNPTMSETTAGDGSLGSWSATTANAGPNVWNTADNWESDTVPVNSDDVIIPAGAADILYGLDQSAVTLTSLTVKQGFTGKIGLPEVNSLAYDEYRDTYLKISATTVSIGESIGNGSSRIKLDTGSNQTTVNIYNSGSAVDAASYAINWIGTHASNAVNVLKGSIGIASQPGESATVATLKVGFISNQAADARVECGSGVTLTNVDQSGGIVTINSATTTYDQTAGTSYLRAGAHAAVNVDGGTCYYSSTGTLTTAKVGHAGIINYSQSMASKTVTNCEVHSGSTIADPFGTVTHTNGIDIVRCRLADVNIDIGPNFTLSKSAI